MDIQVVAFIVSMSRLEGTIERAERRALARDALRELK